MPRERRPDRATTSLAKLARYFTEEMDSRAWGEAEFTKLIREAMMACWFVERAIETVEGLVKKRRAVEPDAVRDFAQFIVSSAEFARDVITVRVVTAIDHAPRLPSQALSRL